jgi:RHS repeat-associated protein
VGLKTEPTTPPTAPDYTGDHRISSVETSVTTYTDGGPAYDALLTQTSEWTTRDSSAFVITSQIYTSADGRREWNIAYPGQPFQQLVKTVTQYGASGSRTVTQTYPDNSYQISTFSYSRPSAVTRYGSDAAQIAQTTYQYNPHGLLWKSTDARNGTTIYYYNHADLVNFVTSPPPSPALPPQTRYTLYDTSLRLTEVIEPDGGQVYTRYYQNGLVKLTWGARVYPSGYEYDSQGRLTKLHTWQSFTPPDPNTIDPAFPSGSVTTSWDYDQYRGWLKDKRYTDTKGPDYDYTPAGRLRSRTWSRLVPGTSTRLLTTYTYDFDPNGLNAYRKAGYLASIAYNDATVPAGEISTPPLAFDYDRRGRSVTAQQGPVGSQLTTTLAWHLAGALDSETYAGSPLDTLQVAAVNVDSANLLRRATLTVKRAATAIAGTTVSYGYDAASRLQIVTSPGPTDFFSAAYDYVPNSSLVKTTTFRHVSTVRLTSTTQYDFLNRLQSIRAVPGVAGQPPLSRAYTYNNANQRLNRTDGDASFWQYGYDNKGQVTAAKHYWYDAQPVPGQQFEYGFDDIGNRLLAREGGDQNGSSLRQTTYVPDNLNRYASRSMNASDRKADVTGLALVQNGTPTTVSITAGGTQYSPDYRRGEYFWKAAPASGNGPTWLSVNVTDGSTTTTGNVYVQPASESFSYDDDGNLISDARWIYKWDAENRLARLDTQVSAAAAGIPPKRILLLYDYQGRLMRRQLYRGTYAGGAITWAASPDTAPGSDLLFLYDGRQCVAALNPDQSLYQAYVWGIDLSGTFNGAGGVGGLLIFRKVVTGGTETYFPVYDGNGNVMELIKAEDAGVSGSAGIVVARYEYSAFGQLLRTTGEPVALENPFRFSSRYQDDQTDLVYYGFRFYSPAVGRWLSRDPLEEAGGINCYVFARNNPVSRYDVLGRNLGFDQALDALVLAVDLSTGAGWATIALDVAVLLVPYTPPNPRIGRVITRLGQEYEFVKKAELRNVWKMEWTDLGSRPQKASIVMEYRGRLKNLTPNDAYNKHFRAFAKTEVDAKRISRKGPAQFIPGTKDEEVRKYIDEAFKKFKQDFKVTSFSQLDGYVYNTGIPFGTKNTLRNYIGYADGECASNIKIHVGKQGDVHAFPTLDRETAPGTLPNAITPAED